MIFACPSAATRTLSYLIAVRMMKMINQEQTDRFEIAVDYHVSMRISHSKGAFVNLKDHEYGRRG